MNRRGAVSVYGVPRPMTMPRGTRFVRRVGPTVSDRPASPDSATAMRPAYPDPTGDSVAQPAVLDRRAVGPVAPMPSGYSRPDDDRYNTAPSSAARPDRQHRSFGSLANRRVAVAGQRFSSGRRLHSQRRFFAALRFPGRSRRRPAEQRPARSSGVLNKVPPHPPGEGWGEGLTGFAMRPCCPSLHSDEERIA